MKRTYNSENILHENFTFHANNIYDKYKLPVSIWQPDKNQSNLIIAASAGLKTKHRVGVSISLTESSVTGDVYKNRKMEIVKDIASEKRWKYRQDAKDLGLKSAVCIPIVADGQPKGVLTVYTTITKSINFNTFKNFLELTAAQIGSSIEIEIRQTALKKLLKIGEKINSLPISEGYSAILKTVAKEAKSILNADLVDLYIYNEDEDKILLPPIQIGKRKSKAPTEIKNDDVVYGFIKGDFPLHAPLYIIEAVSKNTHDNVISQKTLGNSKKQRFVEREKIASTAIIPLVVVEKVVGILFVNYKTTQIFTDHQKELILSFANQASFAISSHNLSIKKTSRDKAINLFNAFAESLGELNAGKVGSDAESGKLLTQKILQKIADGAREVLGADLVDLYQYRQSLDLFPLPIIYSGNRKVHITKNEILKDDYAYSVVKGRRSRYISNVLSEEELTMPHSLPESGDLEKPILRFVVREAIISMAAIPMKVANEIVGVLFFSYHTKQNFSDNQKKILKQFAVQAATAIRAVRILEQRQALVEFGNSVTSKQELDESRILELVREKASSIMDASNMYIALYDEYPGLVRFDLAYKSGEKIKVATRKFKIGKGKTEEIIKTKNPIFHSTQKEANDWYDQLNHQNYTRDASPSWIGVPMINDNKVIGVVATYSDRENVYSSDDLTTLQTIASQAAIALVNARSYVKVEKLLSAIKKFSESSSQERKREPQVLELIYAQISKLMLAKSMYVALFDKDAGIIRFGIAYENGLPKEIPLLNYLGLKEKSMTEEIILTKKPIFISNVKESKKWHNKIGHQKSADGLPNASWLGVPIMLGEEVLGVVAVYDRKNEFVFTSDDLETLKSISNLAGIVLDNAHQYYIIEEPLRALVEFGQQITSQIKSSRKDVLLSIYEKAKTFLDAKNIFIAFCETNEENGNIVRFATVYRNGILTKWEDRDAKIGRIGEIILTKKPLLLPTKSAISKWFEEHQETERDSKTSSWLGVPMILEDKVIGVIGVSHPSKEQHYAKNHLENLQALSNYAAIAFENIRLLEEANAEIMAQKQLNTLGRAMAAIEHRFNNTLPVIVANINRLYKRVNIADPEIEEILQIIERNTRYISLLIDKTRAASLNYFSYVDVDINALLVEIIAKQKQDWAEDSTHIVCIVPNLETDSSIPYMRLPLGQISEVLINLIQNACKQLEKACLKQEDNRSIQQTQQRQMIDWEPKLVVASNLVDGKIRVVVRDNVPGGIPSKIAERLFKRPVPSQTPGEGSGLGLWLSKMIMDSIGGDIKIESADSNGTTMVVEIPLQNTEEAKK